MKCVCGEHRVYVCVFVCVCGAVNANCIRIGIDAMNVVARVATLKRKKKNNNQQRADELVAIGHEHTHTHTPASRIHVSGVRTILCKTFVVQLETIFVSR